MYLKKSFILVLTLIFFISNAVADMMHSPTWGYGLDLPEGFELIDKNGNDAYMFEHTEFPVSVIVRAYPESRFGSVDKTMENVMKNLGAEYDTSDLIWRKNPCIVSSFSMVLNGAVESGWATALSLPETKGILVLLSYTPEEYYEELMQFVISCVDSVCTDRGSYYSSGPITSFAFPETEQEKHTVTIGGTDITIRLDSSDREADEFVIEREYSVLCMYKQSQLWQEAWQRYYRQIFRNEFARLEKAAFTIQNKLTRKLNGSDGIPQALLSWVQEMPYERQKSTSDFAPVTGILAGDGSDCDSRSMLVAILLYHMGYKTSIFVSAEYSHALTGVVLDKPGAKIKLGDDDFLLGETTAPVDFGLVPKDMNNTDKWLGVDFNFF
ncbi:MAG: hypothetical protein K5930_07625 [Treponemataceae bacterium]|nr:hypothetical protein [Treponemataceae bacterium]